MGAAFNQKAQDVNIRQLGQLRMYTVEDDVNITDLAMVDWGAKPTNMTFVHSYFHDGLAGQPGSWLQLAAHVDLSIQNHTWELQAAASRPGSGLTCRPAMQAASSPRGPTR